MFRHALRKGAFAQRKRPAGMPALLLLGQDCSGGFELAFSTGCYLDAAEAFLCSAQRRLTASAMRLRPSGLSLRFFFAGFVAAGAADLARDWVPASKARACCNRAISRSIWVSISEIPMTSPCVFSYAAVRSEESCSSIPTRPLELRRYAQRMEIDKQKVMEVTRRILRITKVRRGNRRKLVRGIFGETTNSREEGLWFLCKRRTKGRARRSLPALGYVGVSGCAAGFERTDYRSRAGERVTGVHRAGWSFPRERRRGNCAGRAGYRLSRARTVRRAE